MDFFRPMRSTGRALIPLLALLVPIGALADGPYLSATASATWQDNVTNAPSGDGTRGAFDLDSQVEASWIRSLDFSTLLTASLSACAEVCTSYSGLDNLAVGPQFTLRHKVGVGPLAPNLYVGVAGLGVGFNDPERSKIEGDVVFGFSQRVSDSLQVLVDGKVGSYDARDIVFCGNYASLVGTVNWDMDETWRLKVIGGWRVGDSVANYTAEQSAFGWVPVDADAFNLPGAWHYVRTFNEPFVAWRVSDRTWSYGAAISPALGRHTSLTLQFEHFTSVGLDRYDNKVVSLSVAHHF